jgi:putative Ca2+/H+ antiporter (TMEM165/GDT1 family)
MKIIMTKMEKLLIVGFILICAMTCKKLESNNEEMMMAQNKIEIKKKPEEMLSLENKLAPNELSYSNMITKILNFKNFLGYNIDSNFNKSSIKNKNFLEQFSLSFSLNFFSEIGDKSFVSIILIYDQISPVILFFVASFCEILMNFVSVAIGYELRAHPKIRLFCQFAGMITAFIFSILLLIEAMSDEEDGKKSETDPNAEEKLDVEGFEQKSQVETAKTNNVFSFSRFLKIINIAWIILLSELGDKSQITTIILSTEYNPIPIFLGTAIAHVLGIILSMTIGHFIAKHSNKRILSFIGALCFIYFGFQMVIMKDNTVY